MTDEVVLKINSSHQDAKILVEYLLTLPYVEQLKDTEEDIMPDKFNLPLFSPKNNNDLKRHISKIETNISRNGLIDNSDVMSNTKNILEKYGNKMVG